ncbi:MAG TPA: ABC transporter permease [Anaerolineales bacterium]
MFEILRQPRLLASLVLGPFLILLIFGIGYRNEARALRTLFVVPQDSALAQQIEENAATLGPQLIYMGTTSDEAQALQRLYDGEVDLVAVTPHDAFEQIQASQQATFILYHHEIDPFQVDYVNYFGQVYIDEVNRRVLLAITQEGQTEAADVREEVASARRNASELRQALEAGNAATAAQNQAELSQNVNLISLAVGASVGVLSGVQETIGPGGEDGSDPLLANLANLRQDVNQLEDGETMGDASSSTEEITRIEQNLAELETQLAEFTSIDSSVLVRPFRSEAKSIARVQPTATDFFAPAVIALLLQHLAITMGALSIVRERTVGTMELFRVSPLTAGETLVGKYLSYLIFGGLLAAILTLLLVYGLRVPMLGSWPYYALVIAVLLFTSLGIGFIISLISQTDSQAVQLTMIVLLASVFFSGFLMSLDLLIPSVRVVSWALPTTYGIIFLRDIFLRGLLPNFLLLGGLALIGLVLYVIAWLLMHRLISASRR